MSGEGGSRAVGYGSINATMAAERVASLEADLVRVTEERDVAQAAYDSLRAASIEHTERHRSIFDEHLRQVAQLTAERDEARDEVVRLTALWHSASQSVDDFRVHARLAAEERDRVLTENHRLRTIIVELGAAEAAEPEEQIEALRPEGQ